IAKIRMPAVEKKLRRLCVSDVAADVADGLVDVSVGDSEIEPAIKIHIEERTTESEAVSGGDADPGLRRYVFETLSTQAIQPDHLIVKVRDANTRDTGVLEIGDIDSHAGTGLSFAAEGNSGFDRDILKGAIVLIAVELVGLRVVGNKKVRPAVAVFVEQ